MIVEAQQPNQSISSGLMEYVLVYFVLIVGFLIAVAALVCILPLSV